MAYTPAPPIDLALIAASARQMNPNLGPIAPAQTPAPPSPYVGSSSGYKPPTPSAPAYTGLSSGYKPGAPTVPNPVPAPPPPTPTPAPQGTPTQSTKVAGGWMTVDGQFIPVPDQGTANQGAQPNKSFLSTPPMPGQTPAPSLYQDQYARTPESIAALAKQRIDTILQAGKTSAEGALTSAKNAYDYSQQTTKGNRALLNFDNSQRGDQFGGAAREDNFRLQRQQGVEDTATNNQYTAQVGMINQKLADLQAAAPGQEQQIIDDLQQMERETGINVAQLQEQQRQNQFNNGMATNEFNRGVYESDRNFGQIQQNIDFNQGMANKEFDYGAGQDAINNNRNTSNDYAANTGYYNPSGMSASQINEEIAKNSAAYNAASPEEKQKLHARNVELNGLLGKTDSTGNGDYVGGNENGNVGYRTVQGQELDTNKAIDQRNFDYGVSRDTTNDAYRDKVFDYQKATDEWSQAFQQGQFDFNKAQTIWENNFKDTSFKESVKQAAQQLGLDYTKMNVQQQQFAAEQAFRQESFKAEQEQIKFDNNLKAGEIPFSKGLEIYKSTGQMPDYMKDYGIDVAALKDPQVKEDVNALYDAISTKSLTPQDALKTINDKVAIGAESEEDGEKLRQVIYTLNPKLKPGYKKPESSSNSTNLAPNVPSGEGVASYYLAKMWNSIF